MDRAGEHPSNTAQPSSTPPPQAGDLTPRSAHSPYLIHTLLASSSQAVFVLDEHRIHYVNTAAAALTGHTPREYSEGTLVPGDLFPLNQLKRALTTLHQEAALPHSCSFQLQTASGTQIPVDVQCFAGSREAEPVLLLLANRPQTSTGAAAQTTELRTENSGEEHESELPLEEETARLASIGIIAAGLTHEINQPLNAIRMGADGITLWRQRNPDLVPEFIQDIVEDLIAATDRIAAVLNHLRSYWVGEQAEGTQFIDLNKAIEQSLEITGRQLQNHQVHTEQKTTEEPARVLANGVLVEQILNNLIVNAIRRLDKVHTSERTLMLSTVREGGAVLLRLMDSAPPVELELPEQIFQPFHALKVLDRNVAVSYVLVKLFADRCDARLRVTTSRERMTIEVRFPGAEDVDSVEHA